jgi:hypothetical protein
MATGGVVAVLGVVAAVMALMLAPGGHGVQSPNLTGPAQGSGGKHAPAPSHHRSPPASPTPSPVPSTSPPAPTPSVTSPSTSPPAPSPGSTSAAP